MAWTWYEEGIDLESQLEGTIERFEDERQAFWKEDPDNVFIDLADEIAALVLKASRELVAPEDSSKKFPVVDWELARQVMRADGILPEHVIEGLQVRVAWELATGTDRKAQRCLQLAREVIEHRPKEAVLKYLRRISRCYIAEFDPECVILCRAAVENGLVETFQRHNVPLPATAEGKSPMRSRLDAAELLGWLTDDRKRDAWTVWKRGSKMAHEDPTVTQAVFETVQMTLGVLRELYDS